MNTKKTLDFRIVEKEIRGRSAWIRLSSDATLPDIMAGQFVQVLIPDSPSTYLRRPISVHDVNYSNNELLLLVQMVGEGTRHLVNLPIDSFVNIILPLGNSFTMPSQNEKVLLVGGGIGVAPLLYLGKQIQSGGLTPDFLLGARSAEDLMRLSSYREVGEVFVTTEDGSLGEKGFVTQHTVWQERHYDHIYVCGPNPMMKAVAALAREKGVSCEVSLENMMACGLGACLCCVEKTKEGHQCVCTDGPVFNIDKLLW